MKIETNIAPASGQNGSLDTDRFKAGLTCLSDFADRFAAVEHTLDALADVSGENNAKSLSRLRKSLDEFEPSITLLGQVKSGKTALINALAGWPDLLPSDVNPWTSVVTSLHLRPGLEHPDVAARFQFMSEKEWNRLIQKGGRIGELAERAGADNELETIRAQIDAMRDKSRRRLGRQFEQLMGQVHEYDYFDKDMLERYICIGDDFEPDANPQTIGQGQFADITRSADLYLDSPTIPFRMCLRDTPGVNDTFMMREQVTINAIRESKICVVVFSAGQALTSVDLGLIRLISNIDARELIIFVNRIDELNDPSVQIPEIEASIRDTLKKHHGPDKVDILFGSAHWANKALSGELGTLGDRSSDALLEWAESAIEEDRGPQTPPEMVWELSGLPALLQSISERIVDKAGKDFLKKTAMSAINVATAQHATNQVSIAGGDMSVQIEPTELMREFERICQRNVALLESELDTILSDFRERADRAHASFVTRTTQSFIERLERSGANAFWDFKPEGLRILLRSAYKVMGTRVQSASKARYETAVAEIAGLLYGGFGESVEGIQIGVPMPADIPPPVSLGHTVALDFDERWWTSWWVRMRGYRAYASRFEALISSETEFFLNQLKFEQTTTIKTDAQSILKAFLDQQKDILLELLARPDEERDIEGLFLTEMEVSKRKTIEKTLCVLEPFAA